MIVFRFFAFVFLLIAVIALVADLTPVLNGTGAFTPVSLEAYWQAFATGSHQAAQAAVARVLGKEAWAPVSVLLSIPAFAAFGLLGILSGYLGRRRRRIVVFSN